MQIPQMIEECVSFIRQKGANCQPEYGIILGTGLGGLINALEIQCILDYSELPHFVQSTVESHHGKLIFGKLGGKPVVCMQGRFHFYEGYTLSQVTFPVRVMAALGISTLIVSNAAGALNHQFRAGDLMLITDHLNLLGVSPLIGPHWPILGSRWPDMCEPYTNSLQKKAIEIALEEGILLQRGVYACMSGPNLETRAEYRMLRILGADAIGMSTVPEVIVAVQAGLKVLGISVLTDECFPDALAPCDIKKILATAAATEPQLVKLIQRVVQKNNSSMQ